LNFSLLLRAFDRTQIAMEEIEGQRVRVIFQLLAESVCQSRKAANAGADIQVQATDAGTQCTLA